MPTYLPAHVTSQVRALLALDHHPAVIATRLELNKRTIERLRLNFELFNAPYAPKMARHGRPPMLQAVHRDFLLHYLEDRPTAYLDELTLALWDDYGISVCIKTVYNFLLASQWSRKVVKRRAQQASAELRAVYKAKSRKWTIDRLVFVDESACCERTGYRKYGWSPKGVDCTELKSLRRGERWSVLPAITVNGYLPGELIVQGSITAEIFVWWLRNAVLPQLTAFNILVMDNASIHHSLEVKEACAEFGVPIEYLPPYSPDFNPIESTFNVLKAWVRRHISTVDRYERFDAYLRKGVSEAIGQDCEKYFVACGYSWIPA